MMPIHAIDDETGRSQFIEFVEWTDCALFREVALSSAAAIFEECTQQPPPPPPPPPPPIF